ncbi:MAG: aconitase X, partial [Nitrososphaeraceae archaeon]
MVKLTDYEKKMLAGEMGKFKQVALKNIVKYAEALGAEELCEVTKATVYLGAHPYLDVVDSDNYDEIFSKMLLCNDETIKIGEFDKKCTCQTCVAPCDQYVYEPLNLTKEFYDKNNKYLTITKEAGVNIVGSCTPYLVGWLPLRGEHFVTTESSNVLFCNSVLSACGNSDGLEAAAWSAICGRTPKWGNHIIENRKGTHIFNVECQSETAIDWDVLGYTIGRKLPPHAIPVISGNFSRPDVVKLK